MIDKTTLSASASHIAMMVRPFGAPRIHMDENASPGARVGGTGDSPAMPESFASPDAAARYLVSIREKRDNHPAGEAGDEKDSSAEGADHGATAETELSSEGNDAPDEDQAHVEDDGDDPEAELPPIARPKSWGKVDQAEWDGLSRSLQEKIAARDTDREKAIRKAQNEAAHQLKGASAKEQEAEQARQRYEDGARMALDVLMREQQAQFGDIRTTADLAHLATTDPLRFIQWQAHQTELAAQAQVVKDAGDRAEQQKSDDWKRFRVEQDKLALEHIPDLGDAKKAPALMQKAVAHLQELGFTAKELGDLDKGGKLSLFDHRIQRLVFDAMRYQDVQKAAQAARTKPVPNVQRPGVKPAGNGAAERVQTLNAKLTSSGSLKDAVALYQARKAARR
jgi:hypothetical protein